MSGTKNVPDTFREVVQDLLVPELKAVKVSVDSLRTEMKLNTEALREELKLNTEAMREEMKLNTEAMREELKLRNEMLERSTKAEIRSLADKLDFAIDIRERLASIEARMPEQ